MHVPFAFVGLFAGAALVGCNRAPATPAGTAVARSAAGVETPVVPVSATAAPDSAVYPRTVVHVLGPKETIKTVAAQYLPRSKRLFAAELVADLTKANPRAKAPGDTVRVTLDYPAAPTATRLGWSREKDVRGVYIPANVAGSPQLYEVLQKSKAAGLNAVIFDLKDNNGLLAYPSQVPLAIEMHAARSYIPSLGKFIRFIHEQGFYAIGRVVMHEDASIDRHHPEWLPKSRSTGGMWREPGKMHFIDPSNPNSQQYLIDVIHEIAAAGIDEVQLDYIRFPTMGNQKDADYHYDETKQSRAEIIAGVLARVKKEGLADTGALLATDIFGIIAWNVPADVRSTGQDMKLVAQQVDVICPMLYASHFNKGFDGFAEPGREGYHFVEKGTRLIHELIGADTARVTIRPYIQAFGWRTPNYSPQYVRDQIRAVYDGGGSGYLFWNAGNKYSEVYTALSGGWTPPPPKPRPAADSTAKAR